MEYRSFLALVGMLFGETAAVGANDDLQLAITERIEAQREDLVELRRDLHRHPEVSGEEERTARVVAERLRELGLEVRTGVGGHGVLAVVEGARPGPTVAYRADMDAVPSSAPDPVEFRSVNEGVRHICGHDVHTTIAVALADAFAAVKDRLSGRVALVFQPAEERATGARAMLADGVFETIRPDAIYAVHTAPFEVGQLATRPGVMMPQRDSVKVHVRGSVDDDVAAVARSVVRALINSGTLRPAQALAPQTDPFSVVQVGAPSRDSRGTWVVEGMATASDPASSAAVKGRVERALAELDSDVVQLDLDYEPAAIAGVTNDDELTKSAVESVGSVVGSDSVVSLTTLVPAFSEDFGSFQQQVPGVMFFLGVSNSEKGIVGMPHSPGYVADEESIFVGAKAMAAVILDRLTAE